MSEQGSAAPAAPAAPVAEASNAPEQSEALLEGQEAQSEESLEGAEEGSPEQAAQEAAKALKKKLKLKVDGQEIEEELDLSDDESLTKYLQKAKAFDKRSQEYAQLRNQVDVLMKELQSNPESIMQKLGYDLDEWALKRLEAKAEELKKSPEQLEREKMQKELEDLRKERERIQKEKEEAEMEAMRNQIASQIDEDISSALTDSKTILPKNPKVVQRIAQMMYFAMQNGFEDVTAKDVLPIVEKEYREELNGLFSSIPEDILEDLIGKPNLDRLRKKRLAAQRQVAQPKQSIPDTAKKQVSNEPKKKIRMSEFFRK